MLEALCGNKNIARILIFLFVNGKCYGHQLHRALDTSLTPLQKALSRLEKGNLITSHYEGKTRVYQFNQAHPLFHELETLLKKTYTLLPAREKKGYYVIREDYRTLLEQQEKNQLLLTFWEKLKQVTQLTFHAKTKSKEETGWSGKGQGEVILTQEGAGTLIFQERGHWHGKEGAEVTFSNVFRWTLDQAAGVISLEHLRRGPEHPVFLFHLAPSSKRSLSSVDSHLCGGDSYFGQICLDIYGLRLHWRVIGPHKNEEIDYYYS